MTMTSSTLVLALIAVLLIPNMTRVPEISNQTSIKDVSQSLQMVYESFGDTILNKANKKISNLNTSRLIDVNIDVKTSRIRNLMNKAGRLFKQLPMN
jgi:hypothetical protein